jgi:hypothetical protein
MVERVQKSPGGGGVRSGLCGGCSNGVLPTSVSASIATSVVCGLENSCVNLSFHLGKMCPAHRNFLNLITPTVLFNC